MLYGMLKAEDLIQYSSVSTNLNSICHGVNSILCDIIQAQLKGCDHHAGL